MPAATRIVDQWIASLRDLGPDGLAAMHARLVKASERHELTYTGDVGSTHVIRLYATPAVLARGDADVLRRLCAVLSSVHRKTVAARAESPALAALLSLLPEEEEWLGLAPADAGPVVARWDLSIDAMVGAKGAQLFEMNGCAVGGLHYGPASSDIIYAEASGVASGLVRPASLTDEWLGLLGEHARHCGRRYRRVAWLEDRTWETGITEGPSLVRRIEKQGGRAVVADPRDLELVRGELRCQGLTVDVLYRSIELRDLVAIERQGDKLTALREAVRRGVVLSPPAGDLDHKSLLEVWSSPEFAPLFSARERETLRRHVPWTRLLSSRRTEGPDGPLVDLPEFTRRERERLVIKPNRACGGEGVLIGPDTAPAAWERAIGRALAGRPAQVVQSLIPAVMMPVTVLRRGRVEVEECWTTYGVLGGPTGVGFLGRAAPFPVVNVARGGGLVGVLLA